MNFNFNSIKLFSEKFPKKFPNFFFEREIDPHVAHRRHYSKQGDLAMEMNSEIIDRLLNILPILRRSPVFTDLRSNYSSNQLELKIKIVECFKGYRII